MNFLKIANLFFLIIVSSFFCLSPVLAEDNNEKELIKISLKETDLNIKKLASIHEKEVFMIELNVLPKLIACQAIWGEPDQIIIKSSDTVIYMYLDVPYYEVNSEARNTKYVPCLDANGKVMIPLELICEELSYSLNYCKELEQLIINKIDSQENFVIDIEFLTSLYYNSNWGTITSQLNHYFKQEKLIASYFTRLISSPAGRTTNIELSANKINETIIKTDEIFSFNQVVGKRTPENGYQMAPIFVGKQVVPGLGGGICQTSSTLYNAVLETQMPILERHPHSMPVSYVPPGKDATVSWGTADLKFCNNRISPVKIHCQLIDDYLIILLFELQTPN